MDIRIPNEFDRFGKFNIGVTAGIETTAVSQKWMEGCNKMDLIIVPSEHSKSGFVKTIYDKVNQLPNGQQQKLGELKLEKPIEVLFEGSDDNIFKPLDYNELSGDLTEYIDKIKEKFLFLSVGQWGTGEYGEDRKDLGRTVKVFLETFANTKQMPGLLLKTNGATFSLLDKKDIKNKINTIKSNFPTDWKLPNIYLLHGELSSEEINVLYNHPKIGAMLSLTHGEGYGRPLQEATMVGLPVIASNWSGQLDFLSTDHSLLLAGELKQVPKSVVWKDIIIPESEWFTVNESNVYKALKFAFENKYEIKNKAKSLMNINREKFTLNKMADKLNEILDKYTSGMATAVDIKLPKLKKVGDTDKVKSDNLPKLKLPKLQPTV